MCLQHSSPGPEGGPRERSGGWGYLRVSCWLLRGPPYREGWVWGVGLGGWELEGGILTPPASCPGYGSGAEEYEVLLLPLHLFPLTRLTGHINWTIKLDNGNLY